MKEWDFILTDYIYHMQNFPSRRSPFLIGFIAIVGLAVTISTAFEAGWLGGLFFLVFAAIIRLLFAIRYLVDNQNLLIYTGYGKPFVLPITEIKSVEYSRSPISSPAASLERLEIAYGKYDAVYISPDDRKGFAKALLNINPSIKVTLRPEEGGL